MAREAPQPAGRKAALTLAITKLDRLQALDNLEHVFREVFEGNPDWVDMHELMREMRRALSVLHQAERQPERMREE